MLFVFSGNDTIAVREQAHNFLMTFEKGDVLVTRVESEDCTRELLQNYAGATSLFGGEEVILIDTPSESEEAFMVVSELSEALAESRNTFVVIEGKLLVADSKNLKKYAKEFHDIKTENKDERFNPFRLNEALLRRDKKTLWILLTRAQNAGLTAEEIIGTLFWQLKMIRLADLTKNATEAGLKPFVYQKAKGALRKFEPKEIQSLEASLVTLYHRGHLGEVNIDYALERWVLTV